MEKEKGVARPKAVLIDAISISNLLVTEVKDINTLQQQGVIKVNEGARIYINDLKGQRFSSISLNGSSSPDIPFDNFQCGITADGHPHCRMDLSIKGAFRNLDCFSVPEWQEQITRATAYIEEEYGIIIDESKATLKYIEINKTFPLNQPYNEYRRPILLLCKGFIRRYRIKEYAIKTSTETNDNPDPSPTFEYKSNTGKIKSNSNALQVIVYNKTEVLKQQGIDVEPNILRFEIKLYGSSKISKQFGTNKVFHLTDEAIIRFFTKFIDHTVHTYKDKLLPKRLKEIGNIFLSERRSRKHGWLNNVLINLLNYESEKQIPKMLDIKELTNQLDKLLTKEKVPFVPQEMSRLTKQLHTLCKDNAKVFKQGNNLLLEELIAKLQD